MIEVSRLSGTHPGRATVQEVSFSARDGDVTALLDSTGALASEVARLMLDRDRPDAGSVLIDGQSYSSLDHPVAAVGAVLHPVGLRPWRSPRAHLRRMAAATGRTMEAADEVLEMVGLSEMAHKRLWALPRGARVRLAVGSAMVADPGNYILEDPFRGLTEEDARWLRQVLLRLTSRGRAVLLAGGTPLQWGRIVNRVVTLGATGVTGDAPAGDFLARLGTRRVVVRASRQNELADLLTGMGAGVSIIFTPRGGSLSVTGLDFDEVCRAAVGYGILEVREADRSLDRVLAELGATSVPRVGVLSDRGIA